MSKDILKKVKETKNIILINDIFGIYINKKYFFNKVINNIKLLGIKSSSRNDIEKIKNSLKKLDNIYFTDNSKDIFYKKRSIGCIYCTQGRGCTVILSYKCNRNCFFCYEETPNNPKKNINPENIKDLEKIYKKIDTSFFNPSNKTLAITGGEPFLFTNKVYEILEYVNSKYTKKHKRIYTSGDLVTEEILKNLKKLGVDEIRYSIKPFEEPNIILYKLTKKYIKTVMIEMPVQPNSYDYMVNLLNKINISDCIDGINLNELTFNNINVQKYKKRGYNLDLGDDMNEIYHRYFDVSKIEIGVFGSKLLCLKLLKHFAQKSSTFFIHYCDLDTVSFHHYLYKREYALSLKNNYSKITKYGLHKILVIYSNIEKAKKILENNNKTNFQLIDESILETSVEYLDFFKKNKDIITFVIYKNYDYTKNIDYEVINL